MATAKKNNGAVAKVSVGIGLTAAAVAAAGAFFLYGSKNAAKNRKVVKSWALKAKAEVLEGLENAKEMTQEEYEQLIENVGKAQAQISKISKTDLTEFKNEMKDNWKAIARSVIGKPAAKKKTTAAPAKKFAPKVKKATPKAKKE